jgi:uncharacterized protein (TIGR03437 family)
MDAGAVLRDTCTAIIYRIMGPVNMHSCRPAKSAHPRPGIRFLPLLLLASAFPSPGASDSATATVPQSPLPLQISAAETPAGATAQIRIYLASPHQIASGRLVVDLDAAVFGPASAVDVFSATGDQVGVANIRDRHIEAQFSSITGGIGQLPGLPAVTILAPVLATAKTGETGSITISPGDIPWKDVQGNQYLPAVQPGRIKVGGNISVNSVSPGGGLLPAEATVRIAGSGFSPSASVQIEGVIVSSTVSASPQAIEVKLGAPADLTGKRVIVRNPDGSQADFYSALRSSLDEVSPGLLIQPIFPLRAYSGAYVGRSGTWWALENQTATPVEVFAVSRSTSYGLGGTTRVSSGTFTVPAHRILMWLPYITSGSTVNESWIYPAVPIRMMRMGPRGLFDSNNMVLDEFPATFEPLTPSFYARLNSTQLPCSEDISPPGPVRSQCMAWQIGTAPPKPLGLAIYSTVPTRFTAASVTSDGGQWLSPSHFEGTSCLSAAATCPITNLNLNPDSLAPGEYQAVVTITPASLDLSPQTLTLDFRVTNSLISVQGDRYLEFATEPDGTPPQPQTLRVISGGDPASFTASLLRPQTNGQWLTISPNEGTTPADVTLSVHPSTLPEGARGDLNYITIAGPANSVTRQVRLTRRDQYPPPALNTLDQNGNTIQAPLTFWVKAGSTAAFSQSLNVIPYPPDTINIKTDSGGNWLSSAISGVQVSVVVQPSGLPTGAYHGSITIASTTHGDYAPAQVPVDLMVWDSPPVLTVSPPGVVLSVPSGSANAQILTITSDGKPLGATAASATDDGNNWLSVGLPRLTAPQGQLEAIADTSKLPPGTYTGTILITAPPDSPNPVTVPVTLIVTPATPPWLSDAPPLVATVVNGASLRTGAVAPGEVVTIFGLVIGPAEPATTTLEAGGKVATNLNGTRVLFDGTPAPILTASRTRIDLVVPYEVAGASAVNVAVEFDGKTATPWMLPVIPSAPAIFTSDGSGVGQASAINDDGASNNATAPAKAGSTITILATGLGQTVPAGVTGEILSGGASSPALPVSVTIGGLDATVRDVTAAPGQVSGILELHVVTPQLVAPGPTVPIVLQAGSARSQYGVTIAVK